VENFKELKAKLVSEGFTFASETDTEVIPNLIEYWMRLKGLKLLDAVFNTLQSLEGNFAVVILDRESKTIIGAKNGSPLVLGVAPKRTSISLQATFPHSLTGQRTSCISRRRHGSMTAQGSKREYNIYDFREQNRTLVSRPVQSVSWSFEQAAKANSTTLC